MASVAGADGGEGFSEPRLSDATLAGASLIETGLSEPGRVAEAFTGAAFVGADGVVFARPADAACVGAFETGAAGAFPGLADAVARAFAAGFAARVGAFPEATLLALLLLWRRVSLFGAAEAAGARVVVFTSVRADLAADFLAADVPAAADCPAAFALPAADFAPFLPCVRAASAPFVAEAIFVADAVFVADVGFAADAVLAADALRAVEFATPAPFAVEFFAVEAFVVAFVAAAPLATGSLAASARPADLDAEPAERRDVAARAPFVFSFFVADGIRKTLLQASRCGDGTNYRPARLPEQWFPADGVIDLTPWLQARAETGEGRCGQARAFSRCEQLVV